MGALRRLLVPGALALGLAVVLTTTASAQSLRDTIMTELHQQGYTQIDVWRTLLGRTRIVAESPQFHREIVFNPSTGTILRDYWRRKGAATATPQIFDPTGRTQSGNAIVGEGGGESGSASDDSTDGASHDSADDGSVDSPDSQPAEVEDGS